MRATAATAAATSAKQECSQPTPEWVYKPSKMARLPCPFMPLLSYAHHIEREPSTYTLSHNPSRCRLPAFRIVDGRLLASSARMRLRPESARLVAFPKTARLSTSRNLTSARVLLRRRLRRPASCAWLPLCPAPSQLTYSPPQFHS